MRIGGVAGLLSWLAILAVIPWSTTLAQPVGLITCDPAIRFHNPVCPTGVCRRIGGMCAGGVLDEACLDDPESGATTAPAPVGCELVCTGSIGRCETGVTACNVDLDCDRRELCLDGACRTGGCVTDRDCDEGFACRGLFCEAQPQAECRADGDCGFGQLCVDQQCQPGSCRGDWQCRTDETCIDHDCAPRCADGEVWVPNPIGFPPIPLGRCQKSDDLIPCCYADGAPFGLCSSFARNCPVDHACAPSGVCFSLCGDGPCPGELPRLPDDVAPPARWLNPRPAGPDRPILWRDDRRPWPARPQAGR